MPTCEVWSTRRRKHCGLPAVAVVRYRCDKDLHGGGFSRHMCERHMFKAGHNELYCRSCFIGTGQYIKTRPVHIKQSEVA